MKMGSVTNEVACGHIYLQRDVSGEFDKSLALAKFRNPDAFLEHLLELFVKTEECTKVVRVRPDLAQKFTTMQCRTQFRSSDDLMKHLLNLHVEHQKPVAVATPTQEKTSGGRKSRKSQPKKNVRHASLIDSDEESGGPSPNNRSSISLRDMSISSIEDPTDISTSEGANLDSMFDLSKVKQEVSDDDIAKAKQNEKATLIRKIFHKPETGDRRPATRKRRGRKQTKTTPGKKKKTPLRGARKALKHKDDTDTELTDDEHGAINEALLEETRQACVVIENVEDDPKITKQKYQYECYRCGQNMRTRARLNLHMASEHNEVSEVGILCKTCGKHIDFDHELDLHLLFICRKSERSFKCDTCSLSFLTETEMDQHPCTKIKRKPFFCTQQGCPFAGKCFKDLTEHVTRHLGIKPFLCNICGRAFSAKKDLDRHSDIHNDSKTYKCRLCEVMFQSANSLKHHMIAHKYKDRFKCDDCGYCTPYQVTLKQHMLKHQQKEMTCHICNKGLRSGRSLQKHISNRHSFNRIFTCRHCDFTSDDGLKYSSHMRKHSHLRRQTNPCDEESTQTESETVLNLSDHDLTATDSLPHNIASASGSILALNPLVSSGSMTLTAAAIAAEEVNISGQHADTIMADYVATADTSDISVITSDVSSLGMYTVEIPAGSESLPTCSSGVLNMPVLMSEATADTSDISVITSDVSSLGMYTVEIPAGSESLPTCSSGVLNMPVLMSEALPMDTETWSTTVHDLANDNT
ncbi:zinc finger protein 37 homolog isoform X2 [Mya arenaria]|uniref:zinc finger protein 37 homolog isoform X2 n=1 Tax=Mya arenaria TaxID=6604 RepID=UPI0022E3C713|nr:zinc finger protein 37 homolog isoform X2 [Mya arenaria]